MDYLQNILKSKGSSSTDIREAKQTLINFSKKHTDTVTIFKSFIFWKKYINKEGCSMITELFTGLYYSRIECLNCNQISDTFEPFTMLTLEIPHGDSITLEECLEKFSKEELMTGNEKYNCLNCKKKTDAKKTIYIWEAPAILIIHLKRFKNEYVTANYSRQIKINSTVKFPLKNLSLDKNYSNIHKSYNKYDLCAISEHMGTLQSGHYIAHAKNKINNKWYKFDDSTIYHVPDVDVEKEIVTNKAYILFYSRQNVLSGQQ